ncbi:chemotaxis protein CheB [Flammeovirga yaeyamensis]|uniref:protein-glutamate methylesterase n=1 Tax=Flammeovirga yaeyamensis TaxID=367791 RepID=A0AAX1N7E6_9BACT|nr:MULTISPECIES: chemotaxis protein CheB [Flammeovirga]ANQ49051.1 chemotaxis protein CheB [Flammeovirga sp. MY04]MBB3699132.1 two-component system chemotaxis response regulator CheB [Flammeovirga yaeyamensis]NMF36565.1 chemotaxis protein CheB [Flammeovirga yaeyamensis]QWG03479.1 chemotaxis protein CheB [Flammeovirga yaeyamensis]
MLFNVDKSVFEKTYKGIVIGGSAGSFKPITQLLADLPKDFPIPIFLCLHRLKHVRHGFIEALSIRSKKQIIEPQDKETIRPGMVYLAPANYHMCIELGNSISLSTEGLINNSRPSIDLTFHTAAYTFKEKMIGILYSGANKDGAEGMKSVKDKGGYTIIQDPDESLMATMPQSAQAITDIDLCLESEKIKNFLLRLYKAQQK